MFYRCYLLLASKKASKSVQNLSRCLSIKTTLLDPLDSSAEMAAKVFNRITRHNGAVRRMAFRVKFLNLISKFSTEEKLSSVFQLLSVYRLDYPALDCPALQLKWTTMAPRFCLAILNRQIRRPSPKGNANRTAEQLTPDEFALCHFAEADRSVDF